MEKRATTPFEEGDPSYPICIIGEAPSTNEIRENRPFVGPAGQLLDRCLHAAQIARARCYITNVFEDQVFKKEDSAGKIFSKENHLLWSSSGGFTPAGFAASQGCFQRVSNSGANVIVPMGAPALTLCLGEPRAITKWRGSIISAREEFNHRKLVPSIHPSGALQGKYEWRYLIISDLNRAREQATFPEIKLAPRRLITDPTFEQCIDFLMRCRDARSFNTDIELLRGSVDCFSLAIDPSEAICITLLTPDFNNRFSEEEERKIWKMYAKLINDPEIEKINQNITFDLTVLLQLNKIVPRGPINDPMVAHSVMNPMLDKKLGVLCSLYTDIPYYKDDGELHQSPKIEDFIRRWEYNAKDSVVSLESWLKLKPDLGSEGYQATYDMTMQMVSPLIFMMTRGITVNEARLKKTREEAKIKLAEIVKRAAIAFNRPILTEMPKRVKEKKAAKEANALLISSPAQLCAYFYGEKKITPYTNDAGRPTVDDLALARILRRYNFEEARVVQEYRKLAKMISTYLEMKYDDDKRLRCSYNIRGTWTGRLSSSSTVFSTGGNMQNLVEEFMSFLETGYCPLEETSLST